MPEVTVKLTSEERREKEWIEAKCAERAEHDKASQKISQEIAKRVADGYSRKGISIKMYSQWITIWRPGKNRVTQITTVGLRDMLDRVTEGKSPARRPKKVNGTAPTEQRKSSIKLGAFQ